MNSAVILSVYFFLLSEILFGQGGFKKKYYLPNSLTSQSGYVFETTTGDLIVIGLTNDNGFNRLTVIGTDVNGNQNWRKDYGNSKFEYLIGIHQNSVVEDGNQFLLTLCVRDSTNKQTGVLIKFNYNGDTLWQKIYRDQTGDIMPQGMRTSVDNGFLITGCYQSSQGLSALIIKTDKAGNELWRKIINKSVPNIQNCFSVVQDSSTKKIIMVGYQAIGSSAAWSTCSNILITDSLGNNPFQTTFNNTGGGGFAYVTQLRDKNFITCGTWFVFETSSAHYKALVTKFDISGSVIWKKIYERVSPYNGIALVHEVENNDLNMFGRSDTAWGYNPVKIQMLRADQNGNIKWQKEIGSAYNSQTNSSWAYEYLRCSNPTKGGGYLLSTWFPYGQNPHPYSIIKIDSLGCDTLESYCKLISGTVEFNSLSDFTFDYFPNPADEKINLKINAPTEKQCFVTLADIHGNTLFNMELKSGVSSEMNTSSWPIGLYFLNLMFEGRVIQVKKLVVTH